MCPPKSINKYVHIKTIAPIMKIDMHKLLCTSHEDGRTILLVSLNHMIFHAFMATSGVTIIIVYRGERTSQ